MRREFPRLPSHLTVGEAVEWIRTNPPSGPIIYFYVVDAEGLLKGVIPTRHLLLEPNDRPLSELLVGTVISVPARATGLEACEALIKHKLMALPVLDEHGRIVGMIDISQLADRESRVFEPAGRDDLFELIGVHVNQAKSRSPFAAFRLRFPWLGCNLGAGIICAFLSGVYQSELSRVVALAFFIPVVLNLAESVSSQSVSLTLELLRGQVPTWQSMVEKLKREVVTGALLGLGSGLVVGLVALLWLGQVRVMLSLVGGIAAGVTGAAVLGLAMPYVLRLFRLEPRVAAGPIALAGADVITLLIYLSLANWLLK